MRKANIRVPCLSIPPLKKPYSVQCLQVGLNEIDENDILDVNNNNPLVVKKIIQGKENKDRYRKHDRDLTLGRF